MIIVFTDEADNDLEAIGEGYLEGDLSRARALLSELLDLCNDLAFLPKRFPVLPEHVVSGIRRRIHGPYLIFYRVIDDRIDILRVLHGARDYEAILFPDG